MWILKDINLTGLDMGMSYRTWLTKCGFKVTHISSRLQILVQDTNNWFIFGLQILVQG